MSVRVYIRDDWLSSERSEVRVQTSRTTSYSDIKQALWTAAQQLWPDWKNLDTIPSDLEHKRLFKSLVDKIQSHVSIPSEPGPRTLQLNLLLHILGGHELSIVVESLFLDEPTADATSRALEFFAENHPVNIVWLIPSSAENLPGVTRLGVSVSKVENISPQDIWVSTPNNPSTAQARKLPFVSVTGGAVSAKHEGAPALQIQYLPIIGRPHPMSPAEQKLQEAIESSPDLNGHFKYNQPITTLSGSKPIVDLVHLSSGLVIEVDSYTYHTSTACFQNDRNRDFELLSSGWRVLRVTHQEVMRATPRVLQKIRAVLTAPLKPKS